MIRKFQSESSFREAVDAELSTLNVPDAFREGVASGIVQAEADMRKEAPRVDPSGMKLRIGTWFIRDDDIPMFEAFAALGGIAATALAGAAIAPATAVTSSTSLAKAIWQVWRKGGRLSKEEMSVLNLLASRGSSSAEDLARLAGAQLGGRDTAGFESLLKAMTAVELRDGSVVALVRKDSDGTWRKLNV
jgi:hypothetical protein